MARDPQPRDDAESIAIRMALGPRHTFPHDRTVLDLFHEQVAAGPGRPAIQHRDTILTYLQFDQAANAIARQLIAGRTPPRSLVPVLITDGPEFPAALFGVLKAGAAFVPLDPAWPAERLRAIAAELDPATVLVTEPSANAAAHMGLSDRIVAVNVAQVAESVDHAGEDRRPLPTDLIYGFYTSGSTGTPKCALNRHRGLVNRLTTMSRRFGDGAGQITLQNSRSTFDSSMWQVLWPLISGGQVVLPHRDGILDLEETAATIGRYGVTITDFVPSVLAAFVSLLELRPDLCEATACLRRMLIGGEAANPSIVHRLRALLPGLLVTNTFGPTECSIGSVFHDITDADVERIPIGRAIDNTAAIVLDEQMRPVPIGATGEVYLGGECVGAGYLGDPERTARTFLPNPFSQIGGQLLYRTGDLAKLDPEGRLHFLGRRDEQVKIGGVRVELGDVAGALASHPLVGNALAIVLGDPPESTLVGCVTPRTADVRPSLAELRKHAAQYLPAESVPHRIMVLDVLPMNRNGKADRKALTALLAQQTAQEAAAVRVEPPANAMEELISDAWREVLGLEEVSVATPFAEYGGTSLSAYRLTVAVSARLGRPVRPRDLLVAATVRAQANRLTEGGSDSTELAYLARDVAWRPPQALLVTGGTGFVGAHLLAELLKHSAAKLVCLVRAADEKEGAQRLSAALESYGLISAWQQLPIALKLGRVEVVAGDLGQERFGLSPSHFARLGSGVNAVVNVGAMVNFLAGYLEHRPANVLGVQELIKLAAESGARIHGVSTLSVFPVDGRTERISADQLPDADNKPSDGYSLSKYVTECLLENARGLGVSSVAYRLGEVWPHRETGVANPASLAHNVLYACARTGCVFETEAVVDYTPVDVVSRFIASSLTGQVYVPDGRVHLLWPGELRFREAFDALSARCRLDPVSYAEFHRRLESLEGLAEPDERLDRVRLLLPPPGEGTGAPAEFDQLFTAGTRYFDSPLFENEPTTPIEALDSYLERLAKVRSLTNVGELR